MKVKSFTRSYACCFVTSVTSLCEHKFRTLCINKFRRTKGVVVSPISERLWLCAFVNTQSSLIRASNARPGNWWISSPDLPIWNAIPQESHFGGGHEREIEHMRSLAVTLSLCHLISLNFSCRPTRVHGLINYHSTDWSLSPYCINRDGKRIKFHAWRTRCACRRFKFSGWVHHADGMAKAPNWITFAQRSHRGFSCTVHYMKFWIRSKPWLLFMNASHTPLAVHSFNRVHQNLWRTPHNHSSDFPNSCELRFNIHATASLNAIVIK